MKIDTAKVLAMDTWQQANFLFDYTNQKPYEERSKYHWCALANAIDHHNDEDGDYADNLLDSALTLLAFRLRNEVGQGKFVDEIIEVFECLHDYSDYKSVMIWLCSEECRPIHWILSSLLAKEKS